MKKTLVLGASSNPDRYSYKAVMALLKGGHEVEAVGLREGEIGSIKIKKGFPEIQGVHTITLYVGRNNQLPLYDYIFRLHPQRVIFNPGAENPELKRMLDKKNIETLEACTLVLLSIGDY